MIFLNLLITQKKRPLSIFNVSSILIIKNQTYGKGLEFVFQLQGKTQTQTKHHIVKVIKIKGYDNLYMLNI